MRCIYAVDRGPTGEVPKCCDRPSHYLPPRRPLPLQSRAITSLVNKDRQQSFHLVSPSPHRHGQDVLSATRNNAKS